MEPLILVVDDEESILDFVEMGLTHEGFRVVRAENGLEALEAFREHRPALIVLDLMLPDIDGLEVCRRIRQGDSTPILMLTARGQLEDKIDGFEAGADDYLPKPFKFAELLVRVKALLRRAGVNAGQLQFGRVKLDPNLRKVTLDEEPVELTLREFELLELLLRNQRRVLTRESILDQVWGWDSAATPNVVEVHVSALRSKLQDQDRSLIRTVRGVGYALGS